MTRMDVRDRTAVITGAGSGIGRAIALSLAKRGCNLALADVNEAGLAETAAMAGNAVRISRHRLDVADREAVAAFPRIIRAAHPGVDMLVNNAGVALGGSFEDVPEQDFEWLFEINFWGVVRMTRAFLPFLRQSPDARIINLSSLYGLVSPPGQAAYSASKFAVRGFSNALREELGGTQIGVTVVHPGGVATSIAKNARIPSTITPELAARNLKKIDRMLRMPPSRAGEIIVDGIVHRRDRVLVGSDATFVALLERLMPVGHWSLLNRLMPAK